MTFFFSAKEKNLKKILIVDDLKPFVEQEKSILHRADVHIFTTTSGSEALSIHKNVKVDLLVADLDMPGMNGDELCSIIRKDPELRYVSILMVIRPREADIVRCKKCGANDYITKPINAEFLLEKATAFLGVQIRKAYRVFVNVTVKGEQEHSRFLANSVNISTAGLLIEAKKVISMGANVNCSFFLPGTPAISVTGEVVRTIKKTTDDLYQYGIRFTTLSDDVKKIIENFVKNSSSLG